MTIEKSKRVCVINTHPIQYYAPFYKFLSMDEDIDLSVFYLSDMSLRGEMDPGFFQSVKWDIDLLNGYDYHFVGSGFRQARPGGFFSFLNFDVLRRIYSQKFDAVVIHGYSYLINILIALAAKAAGSKIFYRSDTNILIAAKKKIPWAKALYIKWFFHACDKILSTGKRNREFFKWIGVHDDKIVGAPFTVDNERFSGTALPRGKADEEYKSLFGIDDGDPVLVFASKFIPGKNAEMTIRIASQLANEGLKFHLIMAGSGEMQNDLFAMASQSDRASILFPGFVNQSEMPALLSIGDVFLFPSSIDAWGLVVNEAMAAGLPVVVGAESGCAPDLVEDGVNGFIVPTHDDGEYKRALKCLIVDSDLRRRASEASLRKIAGWSFRETRAGWRKALGLPTDTETA